MKNKVLNLTLKYQNKNLNYARHLKDFKSKFIIGSNINLFWQILDNKFPDKFELITKKNNKLYMNLRSGMQLAVEKNNQTLSMEELKRMKFIDGKKLILREDFTGTLRFSKEYEIDFAFIKPYVYQPTAKELKFIKEINRKPALKPEEKFTRIFLFFALLATLIGLTIFNSVYEPVVEEQTMSTYLERSVQAQKVTYVQPEVDEQGEGEGDSSVSEDKIGEEKAKDEKQAEKLVEESQETVRQRVEEQFGFAIPDVGSNVGGSGDNIDIGGADYLEINVAGAIAVSGGKSRGATRQIAKEKIADGFNAEKTGKSFNVGKETNIIDLADLGAGAGDSFSAVDIEDIGGKIDKSKIFHINDKAHLAQIQKQFANVKVMDVDAIESEVSAPKDKSDFTNIVNIINAYKRQLNQLYYKEVVIFDMQGKLTFLLYINTKGVVEDVEITTAPGSTFSQDFLEKARKKIKTWRFRKLNSSRKYSWPMTFYK